MSGSPSGVSRSERSEHERLLVLALGCARVDTNLRVHAQVGVVRVRGSESSAIRPMEI